MWKQPEFWAAVAAFLSAIATAVNVWAAINGPKAAAEAGEKLRHLNQRNDEERRLKLWVFTTLMQERATLASVPSVQALNLIDVVFHKATRVREAWADLYHAFSQQNVPTFTYEEKMRELLRQMAIDVGLGESLHRDDFSRTYYPTALARQHYLQELQTAAQLQQLQPQNLTANTATSFTGPTGPAGPTGA